MPAVTIAELVRATLRHGPDAGSQPGPPRQFGDNPHQHCRAGADEAHCVLTANVGLPHRSTREAITLAVDLVVPLARVNGRRTVTQVAHVRGYDAQQDRFVVEPWLPEVATQEGATA